MLPPDQAPTRPPSPAHDAADIGDRRTLYLSVADTQIGRVSLAAVVLLIGCAVAGFITTLVCLMPDFFQSRSIYPFHAAAAGLVTALCIGSLVSHVRGRNRVARSELERLTTCIPPVPAEEAAVASLLAASHAVAGANRFDTALYLRGAGASAPRLIFIGIEPPLIPAPESPGEVVPVPVLRRGVWSGSLILAGANLFNLAFFVPGAIHATQRGDSTLWLNWFSVIFMAAMVPMSILGYMRLKQPRYVIPGALCDDATGERVFVTNEHSVLVVRRASFPRSVTKVIIHNLKVPDTSLYFTNQERLVDFIGRWLLPVNAPLARPSAVTPPPLPPHLRANNPSLFATLCRDLWCAAGTGIEGTIFRIGVVGTLLLPFAAAFAKIVEYGTGTLVFGAFFVTTGMMALGLLLNTNRLGRLSAALKTHRNRLCLQCQYPLPSAPSAGVCPECGVAYTLAETMAYWQDPLRAESKGASRASAPTPPPAQVVRWPEGPAAHPPHPPTGSAPGTAAG